MQMVSIRRRSNSRAITAAGTRPPRVMAAMPLNGPRATRRQASARESRCNWSQDTGNIFCSAVSMACARIPLAVEPHLARCGDRSEEHTSELQSLMRISYAVFCLKKKNNTTKSVVSQYQSTQYIITIYTTPIGFTLTYTYMSVQTIHY